MAFTSLPKYLPQKFASGARLYRLNKHDSCGFPQITWDSDTDALCGGDQLLDMPINADVRPLFCITGATISAFSFSVYNWENQGQAVGVPRVQFTMFGGQKASSVKLLEAIWTPPEFTSGLIFQLSGLLLSDVYIFGQVDDNGPASARPTRASFRFNAARLTTSERTSFAGPDVVLAGPF